MQRAMQRPIWVLKGINKKVSGSGFVEREKQVILYLLIFNQDIGILTTKF